MRVLQIAHCYYPPFLDCARQYAALFKGTGYSVLTVYLTGEPSEEVVNQSASDEVLFLNFTRKEVGGLKLKAIGRLRKLTRNEEFTFCIAHRVKPTYLALIATNLPVISVHHNYGDYHSWRRRLLVNWYKHRLLMLGVSNAVRDDLRQDLKQFKTDQIQTLYNHLDVPAAQDKLLSKAAARNALNLSSNAFVFANVGRLHHDKDQETLIKAFASARPYLPKETVLMIVGDGPLKESLHAFVNSLGLDNNVIFTGNLTNAQRYFRAFDVFVLSSYREPFGMVLLEAMAAELPIICAKGGGGEEVVAGIGRLFPYRSVSGLSQCMKESVASSQDQEYQQKVNAHLKAYFSDESAKQRFWGMQQVQEILKA